MRLPAASHFWRAVKLALPASKTVPIFSCKASTIPPALSSPKITTLIPKRMARRVKVSFEIMPPKPVDEVSEETTDKVEASILGTWRMISPFASKRPPTEVDIKSFSAPKPVAIKVASSSLSENLSSVLETTSFSFAMGMTLLFQSSV